MASNKEIERLIAVTRGLIRYWEDGPTAWLARLADPLPPTLRDAAGRGAPELARLLDFDPFADLGGAPHDTPGPGANPRRGPHRPSSTPNRPTSGPHPADGILPISTGRGIQPARGPVAAASCMASRTPLAAVPPEESPGAKAPSRAPDATAEQGGPGLTQAVAHSAASRPAPASPDPSPVRKDPDPAARPAQATPSTGLPDQARAPGTTKPSRQAAPTQSAAERLSSSRRAWARQRAAAQPATGDAPRAPATAGVPGTASASCGAAGTPASTSDARAAPPPGLRQTPSAGRTPPLPAPSTAPSPPPSTAARSGGLGDLTRATPGGSGDRDRLRTGSGSAAAAAPIDPIQATPVAPPPPGEPAAWAAPVDDLARQLADSAYLQGIDQT